MRPEILLHSPVDSLTYHDQHSDNWRYINQHTIPIRFYILSNNKRLGNSLFKKWPSFKTLLKILYWNLFIQILIKNIGNLHLSIRLYFEINILNLVKLFYSISDMSNLNHSQKSLIPIPQSLISYTTLLLTTSISINPIHK